MPGEIQNVPPQPIAFGKYTLLERISHGGMAEVFRAKTQGTAGFERVVAIKVLLPQVANDSDFVTMLIDEAKIAGQLSHANIAQIFDLGQVEGRYFIVQEYVPGRDLRAIFNHLEDHHGRLSPAQACHVILKICEALDYAHNKRDGAGQPLNLVHRDISPQNVIVSHEGEVKLIDFGIVKAEGRATRTLAGLVKGKFAYMSPEQIRGLPVDRRSDVFACGIILHELLTGQPLFKRGSEFETLQRARSGAITPPSQINPSVPATLDQVVLRALARHVDDRYQSAAALRDDLWDVVRANQLYHSRDQLGAWMLETFGGPAMSDLEPASSVDLAPIAPPVGAPRSRMAPGPLDDDEDHENMTVVDADLQARLRMAIEDGDGDTVAAILGSSLAPPDQAADGAMPTVHDLAHAAQSEPDRAVFSSEASDSVLALAAIDGERAGEDETTRAHPGLEELVAGMSGSSSSWAEPQTPTRRRVPLDARDQDGDDTDDPIARLARNIPPAERPYLPFDPAAGVAARAGRGPVATAGPDQRTIGPAHELPVPSRSYPPPAYPMAGPPGYPMSGPPGFAPGPGQVPPGLSQGMQHGPPPGMQHGPPGMPHGPPPGMPHGPHGMMWPPGPPPAAGVSDLRPAGRYWLVVAVAVLVAALTVSIVLAVTSG
ncbi:MAG TPA: protein kinase [Kofleriaceae bacterium]|nr:protein kinase [Kofleriaceae bacterium]